MGTVGDCEEGLSGLQTRSHSASLAAVLRVQGRIDFYRQTAAVTAPLRSKNRRLLKVCNPDSPSSQSYRRLLTSFALGGSELMKNLKSRSCFWIEIGNR